MRNAPYIHQSHDSVSRIVADFTECTISVSNSLDPDQDRHIVGSDLGPNCLQMLSADDNSKNNYQ